MMSVFENFEWGAAVRLIVMGIGVTASVGAQNWTAGSNGAIYYNGGNVGIGTASPAYNLTVAGNTYVSGVLLANGASQWGAAPMVLKQLSGNPGIVVTDGAATNPKDIAFGFDTGLSYGIIQPTHENVAFMPLALNPFGGNVGIGTTNPQHLLQVAGTIGAEEVLVTSTGADYVFQPDYHLQPLGEVAKYIEANHHLPDIPSADDVKQKGMGVGEMEAKLLAKIEELTLHMIEADKRIAQVERENRQLQQQVQESREQHTRSAEGPSR